MLLFLHEIISYMAFLFTGLNLSTRILDKFISGELGNDSGRSSIKIVFYKILDNSDSITGIGYFGSQRFGYIYPHDIILDFQLSYGYVLGDILLIGICCLCILFLISCLLSGNHVSGDAINCYTFVEYHVSCYACSSCLK